jgi:chromosome segregation ATPase
MQVKTVIIGGFALAVLALAVWFVVADPHSYFSLLTGKFRKAAEPVLALEDELERLRLETGKIGPDIERLAGDVARQMTEVQRLEEEYAKDKQSVGSLGDKVANARRVQKEHGGVTVNGVPYDGAQAEQRVVILFDQYQVAEQALNNRKALLDARKQQLGASKEHLQELHTVTAQLEVEIERAAVELETAKTAQLASKQTGGSLDTGRVAAIRKGLQAARDRLQTEKNKEILLGHVDPPAPAPADPAKLREIDEKLGKR